MTSAVGPHHPSVAHLCPAHTLPHASDWAQMTCYARKAAAGRTSAECLMLCGQLKPKVSYEVGRLGLRLIQGELFRKKYNQGIGHYQVAKKSL